MITVEQALRNLDHTVDRDDANKAEGALDIRIEDEWDGFNPVRVFLDRSRIVMGDPMELMFRPRVRRTILSRYSQHGWTVEYNLGRSNTTGPFDLLEILINRRRLTR